MADNAHKRAMVNRALAILNAGRTVQAGMFFTSLTDAQFANWTTISQANQADARLAVMLYEPVLKEVLEEIAPQFACEYADLGYPYMVNQECGGWDYLFELPSDFLCLVAQVDEGNPRQEAVIDYDPEVLHLKGYAHTVVGTDGNVYYCKADHTSADANKPITGGSYSTYWTLDSTEELEGASWVEDMSYLKEATGPMLATNALNNANGTGAYIKYLAYAQTDAEGNAGRSDQPQYYPESFKNAFAMRLAAEMALDGKDYERRRRLLEEYELIAKPYAWTVEKRHRSRSKRTTIFEARTRR